MPTPLLDQPLAFVDVETTGTSFKNGGVIDVGVVRIENGQVVSTFQQLVNPGSRIPQFISNLTGITNDQLEDAPAFAEIADQFREIVEGCIFVAHNVQFDYAFIKEEFRRLDMPFNVRQLCTVKLSRTLYPELRSHKLASLIDRFGLKVDVRHRALADAETAWQAMQVMVQQKGADVVEKAMKLQLRHPSLPIGIDQGYINNLPEGPGVYIFKGDSGAVLYVGKSINIKQRVLSHFSDDHRVAKELRMSQEVTSIEAIPTTGELSALLKESELVKTLLPIHNQMLRRKSELVVALQRTNGDGYPTIVLDRYTTVQDDEWNETDQISLGRPKIETRKYSIESNQIMAVYTSERQAKESLIALAKEYQLCHKLLGLQKTAGACFMHQLKVCQGACLGKESAVSYAIRLQTAFSATKVQQWPYFSPVLVTEKDEARGCSTGFIIDHWCILGLIEQVDQQIDVKAVRPTFDIDSYKILKRCLNQAKYNGLVQRLDQHQLAQLASISEP
jgi:DNA polymerase-3 subunit epsilon